jgi:hypothetical protein
VGTVASAATITLPTASLVDVTGVTNITSVTASYPGRIVVLRFADVLTFTDGSNLKLAGNFATTADDTITLDLRRHELVRGRQERQLMPPPIIPSPYDKKISTLQKRLGKFKHPGQHDQLQNKLQKFRVSQYGYEQQHRPPAPLPPGAQTQLDTTTNNLGLQRDTTLTGLQNQQNQLEQAYGFNDTSNPFARARLLEQSFHQAQAGTQNSYASQGQLYAGSLSNALGQNRNNFEQNLNSEISKYQGSLSDLAQKRLEAQTGYTTGVEEAKAKALQDALAEPPDPSEAPGTPQFVKQFQARLQKKLKHSKGHKNKSQRIRQQLRNLPT